MYSAVYCASIYSGILGSHTPLRNHSGPVVAGVVKLTVKGKPYFGRRGFYLTKKSGFCFLHWSRIITNKEENTKHFLRAALN